MKRTLCLLMAVIIILSGCAGARAKDGEPQRYGAYKEIPGVTQEEIAAVEALRVIDTGEIAASWQEKAFDYQGKLLGDMAPYFVAFVIMLSAAFLVIFVFFIKNRRINKSLERLVAERASELSLQTSTLTTIFESIPDLVFCKDLDMRFTRCNRSFERYFNCVEEALVGKNEADGLGLSAERAREFGDADREIICGGKVVAVEEVIPSADGSARFFETIKTPLMQDGAPIGIMGISRDITQRKTMEEAIKLTLDNLDTCIYINEIETGKILFINNKMEREFGGEGFTGKICWRVLQDNFEKMCEFCPIPKLLKSGDDYYVWEEHNTVTGKYYKNTDSLIKWHDGRLVHMQHSVDITDIKTTQLTLDRRLGQQALMASIAQSFLSDTEVDTLITDALRMTGEFIGAAQVLLYKMEQDGTAFVCRNEWIAPELGLDTRIGEALRVEGPIAFMARELTDRRERCMSSNNSAHKEAMARYRKNFVNYITTPIFIKGKLYGALDFSREDDGSLWSESDVNLAMLVASLLSGAFERSIMQSDLIAAKELAERGSRSKSDFLSRMSHEIRTPLNAVIGMVGIAMTIGDPDKIRHCLEQADSASKHLLGVINDILDMSKIEAGKFELDSREFNFEKMLMSVTNVTNFRAEEKKQNFIVNLSGNVPASVVGDDLRLAQVITNLLSNAVKFTPEGGTVMLSADMTEDAGGEITLKIEVADTGIGISREQQSRLFTSFEQADGGIARKFGGTGLGLAISKRIVEMMGGSIWIESEPGHGSRFIFTIKSRRGKEQARTELSEKIGRDNLRILAVDDAPEVREYFSHVARSLDLPFEVASGGNEALEMIKARGDKPYNVFFIDWRMPGMDGIELTRQVKKITGDNSVVFMISVGDWNLIEKEALSAGVKSFVSKPLFPSTLVNAINECLEPPRKKPDDATRGAAGGSDRIFEGYTILIAEDIEINREIMSAILEETGIAIDYAENGILAVSMFRKNPDKYDLILMDIQMPEMDGYDATREIRSLELPRAGDIPIVAMTANVFREDIDRCLSVGMNDHTGKPIDPEDLFAKLSQYLAVSRSRGEPSL